MQQMYQCPNCGAQVAFDTPSCPNCRTQLNWPTQQQSPPQYQQQYQPPPQYQQQYQQPQQPPKKQGMSNAVKGALVLFVIFIAIVASCAMCLMGDSKPQLADSADELELRVNNGMTLDKVYDAMTSELREHAIIYPAQNIVRQADGKWQFTAKEGGSPGDIDAPFQVLIFYPSPIGDPYYMIFFDNEKVFHHAWFEYDVATAIQKLLWTTETTD
ncbi:MAG: zinc ribbon domain-containing protein [Dehalococcoidia bacterium]|nr:zinc ribbon domain-containing protein [Dehalococcoidia bacterium]